MKDQKRIPKALNVLKLVWKEFPEKRLGEIIGNALGFYEGPQPDLYFVEDKALAECLWRYRVKHGSTIRPTKKKKKAPKRVKPKRRKTAKKR